MKQPEGFVQTRYEDYICKLVHTIYGTMQGGHNWYKMLQGTYNNLGYSTSQADPCVHFKKENSNYTLMDTYTDDVFGASNDDAEMNKRKDEIGKVWETKDMGENKYFLGMRVQQDLALGTIRFTQRPYWEHIINRLGLEHITPRNAPYCQRTPQSISHYSRHLRQSPIHPSTQMTEPPPAARDPTVV